MLNKIKFTKKQISHFKKLAASNDYLADRIFLTDILLEQLQEPAFKKVLAAICALKELSQACARGNDTIQTCLELLRHELDQVLVKALQIKAVNFEEILLILEGENAK